MPVSTALGSPRNVVDRACMRVAPPPSRRAPAASPCAHCPGAGTGWERVPARPRPGCGRARRVRCGRAPAGSWPRPGTASRAAGRGCRCRPASGAGRCSRWPGARSVQPTFSAGGRSSSKTSLAISFLPSVGRGVLQHRQEAVGLDDAEHLGEQRLLVERREADALLAVDQLGEPVLEAQALGAVEQVLDRLADLLRRLVRALGLPRPVEAGHVAGAGDRVGGGELEQVVRARRSTGPRG